MKKSIGFVTYCSDDKAGYFGIYKMINSFYKHHPDIPLHILTTKDIIREKNKYQEDSFYYLNPIMSKTIAHKYDIVVHIDADCIVTDRLDEIIEGDYDIAVVRNNSDQGTGGCGEPCTANGAIDVFKYANCGLVASAKKEFWDAWILNNRNNKNKFFQHEQDIMNLMLKNSTNINIKILDPVESNCYYGVSNAYGTKTHWDSWKNIEIKDNKLFLNNKKIKILHHAGGFVAEKLKLDTSLFTQEVADYLKNICNIVED